MASISGFGTGCAAPTAGSVASRRARRLVAGAGLLASLMGASPVASLRLGEFRFVGHRLADRPTEIAFVGATSGPRARGGLTVYDGGRR